jgi:hypothetical protein
MLKAVKITCYDCATVYSRDERECPKCALRTCITEGYENEVAHRLKSGAVLLPGSPMMQLIKQGIAKFRWH